MSGPRKAAILALAVFCVALLVTMLACGHGGASYSDYPGVDLTCQFIATVAAANATRNAR